MATRKNSSSKAKSGAVAAAGPHAPFGERDLTRIAACYGLLARAAYDIGIKAEGSAKLSRALEDVAQARDTLGEMVEAAAGVKVREGKSVARNALELAQIVGVGRHPGLSDWTYWVRRERRKRKGEG